MNIPQRAILLLSAIALLSLVWMPPSTGYQGGVEFLTLWQRQWVNPPILLPVLLTEIAVLLSLTTMLVLAFKPPPK